MEKVALPSFFPRVLLNQSRELRLHFLNQGGFSCRWVLAWGVWRGSRRPLLEGWPRGRFRFACWLTRRPRPFFDASSWLVQSAKASTVTPRARASWIATFQFGSRRLCS
jgi:hypothetical protein